MTTLTEYFEKTTYKAKYEFGTRVFGYYKNIPFVGTIYIDNLVSLEQGPRLVITLDLPIYYENKFVGTIIDSHKSFKNIKKLIDFDSLKEDIPNKRKTK